MYITLSELIGLFTLIINVAVASISLGIYIANHKKK